MYTIYEHNYYANLYPLVNAFIICLPLRELEKHHSLQPAQKPAGI